MSEKTTETQGSRPEQGEAAVSKWLELLARAGAEYLKDAFPCRAQELENAACAEEAPAIRRWIKDIATNGERCLTDKAPGFRERLREAVQEAEGAGPAASLGQEVAVTPEERTETPGAARVAPTPSVAPAQHREQARPRVKAAISGHWHFVGILGSGMRSLARYAVERGFQVSGCDAHPQPAMADLSRQGISVRLGYDTKHIDSSTDLVVIGQSIRESNPEVRQARRSGVEVLTYHEAIDRFMAPRRGIAVAGSYGKSTTAALIAYIMQRVGMDPSYIVGAEVPQLGGSAHYGNGPHLVVEASEYKRAFLHLSPYIGVLTNIDLEHIDYYYDLQDIQDAFRRFAELIDSRGSIVLNADDPNSSHIPGAVRCGVLTYGVRGERVDYRAGRIWRAKQHTNFDLLHQDKCQGRFSVGLLGTHNVKNALAAMTACHRLGVEFAAMHQPLAEFQGASRRLQLLGEPWGIAVLTDRARHPTEIRATLAAAHQRFPKRRMFCVFQPHEYSRTRAMLPDLADAFRDARVTLISDIYAGHDTAEEQKSVSATDLVQLMNHHGLTAHYMPDLGDIEDTLVGDLKPGDVVLAMGAPVAWQVAYNILPRLSPRRSAQVSA